MRTSASLLSLSLLAACVSPVLAQEPPASGWLYVGRVAEGGRFTAAPSVDAKASTVTAGKVTRLQLARDAALSTGDECTRLKPEDLRAPSAEDLNRPMPLLRAGPVTVEASAECPSAGKGKLVYAKVSVPKDRVRYASLAELGRR